MAQFFLRHGVYTEEVEIKASYCTTNIQHLHITTKTSTDATTCNSKPTATEKMHQEQEAILTGTIRADVVFCRFTITGFTIFGPDF